jgi:hypothetical protein
MERLQSTASLLDQDGDGDLDADDADDLFDECDADHSGSISVDELHDALCRRLNEGAARLVAEQIMTLADQDGSGDVSRDELRAAIAQMASGQMQCKEQAEALERTFDGWLGSTLVPRALVAIRKRKLVPVRAPAPPNEA